MTPVRLSSKWYVRWLKYLLMGYVVIGVLLYLIQDWLLFHPTPLPRNHVYKLGVPFKEENWALANGDTINLVKFFTTQQPAKGVVLYFHGNKQNLERYAPFAQNFTSNGWEVWMEDYPGYGKSTGQLSEANLYAAADMIYKKATGSFTSNQVILFGKSFGTGIAAHVAARYPCRQLILETPYSSIPDLFACYAPIYPAHWMSRYKIPTFSNLQKVTAPITIFHGTEDGVIPYRCASQLKAVLKSTDQFVTIPGGNHHNLNDYPKFHQVLDSLLR